MVSTRMDWTNCSHVGNIRKSSIDNEKNYPQKFKQKLISVVILILLYNIVFCTLYAYNNSLYNPVSSKKKIIEVIYESASSWYWYNKW